MRQRFSRRIGKFAPRLLVFATLFAALLTAQDVRKLTILHTNDLHAHLLPNEEGQGGFAYLATVLREQRAACQACLYLNAGDLVQGSPVSTIFDGTPVFQIANLLGIDAAALGNHEFDYGWAMIRTFVRIAHYPLISANVVNAQGALLTRRGYVILKAGGIRIAVIGVVLGDLVGSYATPQAVGPWHVVPVVDAVRKTVAEIGNRADMIVVLGHIHSAETDQILNGIPEVSIVIAGHEHKGYTAMKRHDGRVAVEAKSYGVELGRLDVTFDTVHHKVQTADWQRIPIDSHKVAPAADVARLVAYWEAKVSKTVDVPIGESRRTLKGNDLRLLVERAMAEETGSDLAWTNQGNIRDVLPQGKLLARSVWNILPFDNRIVIGRFRGSRLPAVVAKEHTIDPNREYTLAVTDFSAENQASTDQMSTTGLAFPKIGPLQRDAVIDWIKKKHVIE